MERGVLLQVLIQDPVVAGETEARSIVHPVVIKDSKGFTEGPTCRRVAIVDLDFTTGRLRPPAKFNPRGSPYKNIAIYEVAIPTKKGTGGVAWARSTEKGLEIGKLGSLPLDDPFMKVSVFGTVLRTLTLLQDPAVLGKEIPWAFAGKQLLVVPRAAELDNAFYHRESHSLQFYYGTGPDGQTVYSGLSQDIVAHETTHAIIDGIAPDLYDAVSPESLAIHEGLADLTAGLLSMRNRELTSKPGKPIAIEKFEQSSRFSKIAEEFGRWRGHGEALRDICNTKSLDTDAETDRRIDSSSPHSTSQVLSGLMFAVFRSLFATAMRNPAIKRKAVRIGSAESEGLRYRLAYASNRTLGLAFRGLDWLPPGDASFADLVAAIIAADREYFPQEVQVRKLISKEARLRGIRIPKTTATFPKLEVPLKVAAREKLIARCKKAFGIPDDARVTVTVGTSHIYQPPLLPMSNSEVFELTPDMSRYTSKKTEHILIKLAWWQNEENGLKGWGSQRRYRSGATIVAEKNGTVRTVLRNLSTKMDTMSRSDFLKRMLLSENPKPQTGPDGELLQRGIRANLENDTLFITGAMQALHIVGETE
jgi:hypothetical protein